MSQNITTKQIWFAVVGLIALMGLFSILYGSDSGGSNDYSIYQLVRDIETGRVASITQEGDTRVIVEMSSGSVRTMNIPSSTHIEEMLRNNGLTQAQIEASNIRYVRGADTGDVIFQLFIGMVPALFVVWLLWRRMRPARRGTPSS